VFTGLIEDVGTIAAVAPGRLTVETAFAQADLEHGASVAVDGVCLTVVAAEAGSFSADVSPETLQRTTLGALQPGARVNLERPMALGDRLGGHLVLGHVDGVGRVVSREPVGDAVRFVVQLPAGIPPLVVEKGSIALDGISLTVNDLPAADQVALMLIPESLRATTWGAKRPGERVNVEADILGKHVARLLQFTGRQHG
jgi:riboflavin synthase